MNAAKRRLARFAFTGAMLLIGQTILAALGSAFTYQGKLAESGGEASGIYDFRFSLHDAASGGLQVGEATTNASVTISNGAFTVTLDFGANAFDGNPRWLEIAVRKGADDFTVLSPRQPVTPVPYALTAASLSAPLPESQLPSGIARLSGHQTFTGSNNFSGVMSANNTANEFVGHFWGNGAGLTNLDTSALMAATNDLHAGISAEIEAATNALWIASTNLVTVATNDLEGVLSARIVGASNGTWSASASLVAVATNDLSEGLLGHIAAATNAPWIASTNLVTAATNGLNSALSAKVVAATNDLNAALSARIVAATNAPWIASTNLVTAATNGLNSALSAKVVAATNDLHAGIAAEIEAATNAPWIASTNLVTAATNGLNTALSAKIVAATNDLNAALSAKIVAATNAPWIASTSLVTAATNSLNTALSAKVVAATNDLNTALSARITAATNASWIASTNWVVAQGYQTTNGLTRRAISSPTPSNGTNYVMDFANEAVEILATNHITLVQSTNRPAAGWYGECVWYIRGGVANRTLRVNNNWIGVGTLAASMPYTISANKLTIVALSALGSGETNVTYAISRQE